MNTTELKVKSFWERPEGTTGMVVGIAAVAALGWGFIQLVPILLALAVNTVALIGMGLVLFTLLWFLLDRRTWLLGSYAYQSAMRALTGLFITIDPIGILRNYADGLRDQRGKMQVQIDNLRDQIRSLERLITQNKTKADAAMQTADAARREAKQGVFVLRAREHGRLTQSNMTLQALLGKMQLLYRVLNKYAETSDVLIADMEGEIEVRRRERDAIRAGHSAMRAARRIMNGDPDSRAIFDQTLEYLADDYGKKLSEIEGFVDMSRDFIDSVDLQNGQYEAAALATLEEWERRGDSILLGDATKVRLIEQGPTTLDVTSKGPEPAGVPADRNAPVDFDRLFKA